MDYLLRMFSVKILAEGKLETVNLNQLYKVSVPASWNCTLKEDALN